ncbi:hypothetical protein R3W88_007558 [Solanum pinnatisectum]|uniref:Uncharacterized protein n=1 Tax=Solanum pinnatisectum TaxID=50273 RepID=A0AAV9M5Z4_9SOLN|nr:hypothetical protein R3W88_007558 [Solanum pinnatisectum]
MALRLNIDLITTIETPDWTCKVQIVDMITSFDHIVTMFPAPTTEIDIILRCGPLKYVGALKISVARLLLSIISKYNISHYPLIFPLQTHIHLYHRCFIAFRKRQFLLTLWEDFGEVEGAELQIKIERAAEFPLILARSIRISPYQDMIKHCPYTGLSLQSRFNSTIHINPTNPQALELINWYEFF